MRSLPEPLARWRVLGITAKLNLAIGGAVALTMTASLVAWLAFVELGHHQRLITREHIPSITDSLRLAQQTALIAATAPRLVAAYAQGEQSEAMEDLRQRQLEAAGLVEKIAADIGGHSSARAAALPLDRIRETGAQLDRVLGRLSQTVANQLAVYGRLDQLTAEGSRLHRQLIELLTPLVDDRSFYLATGWRTLADVAPVPRELRLNDQALLDYDNLWRLVADGNLIDGLLAESATTPDPALLLPIAERLQSAHDRFALALDRLQIPEAPALRRLAADLFALGEPGIIEARRQYLTADREIQGYLAESRELAASLTDDVGQVVDRAEAGTRLAVAASERAIDIGQLLLLALNAISIVGAIAIALFYVRRRITAPVDRITHAAAAFEALRFDPETLASERRRPDELGNLARVFTRMAEEVRARTEVLDELVTERTRELNAKNEALERSLAQIADELSLAQVTQLSILPKQLPEVPELELYAKMRAAREVGGDFYDVIPLDDDRVGIVIGDVSGKGVPAALFMAVCYTVSRSIAARTGSPAEMLAQVNDMLCEGNAAELFVTLLYAVVDRRRGRLTYANGGHLPPYLLRSGQNAQILPTTAGMGLGVMPGVPYQERTVQLIPGDTLFFYTDGITEAFDPQGDALGEERLCALLEAAREMNARALGRHVIARVREFHQGAPQSDDITCVVLRYLPAAEEQARAA
jgi:serine phosphatase RsbU (regulator of sigma subunit)